MSKVAKGMIDPDDAVLLLIDHQSGLFQLVKDMDMLTLRNNVIALAKAARLTKVPTFTTASVPDGPNGPLIPEIHEANPEAIYIPRTGQINAWDNPKWVEAIENTGRKTLIIAGTLTSVCMAFPTLSALAAGYKVFNVVDASGNFSSMATDITLARVVQAGAIPDRYVRHAGRADEHLEPARRDGVRRDHEGPHRAALSAAVRELRESAERAEGRARDKIGSPDGAGAQVIRFASFDFIGDKQAFPACRGRGGCSPLCRFLWRQRPVRRPPSPSRCASGRRAGERRLLTSNSAAL